MSDQADFMTDAQVERLIARLREQPDSQGGYGPGVHERTLNRYQGDPIMSRQTITVSTTILGLTIPDYARLAVMTVTTNPIRVTFDGTPPAAAVGQHWAVNEHFTIVGVATLKGFQTIREGAADGTLDVEYFD